MRIVAAALLSTLFVGCGQRPAEEPVANAPIPKKHGNAKAPLEGVYCTADEISGFSGTTVELNDGRFRYWFYSDVVGPTEPKYPLTGEYTLQDGTLTLKNKQVGQDEWFPDVLNGRAVLLRPDALDIWRKQKKIYDYGVLIKAEGKLSDDGNIARPSIKCLYGADQKGKEWKDPFVQGPQ